MYGSYWPHRHLWHQGVLFRGTFGTIVFIDLSLIREMHVYARFAPLALIVPRRQWGENRDLIKVAERGSYGRRVMSTPTNVSIATIYSDRCANLHMIHVLRRLSGAENVTGDDDYSSKTRLLQ